MWISIDEAIAMYARFWNARYGAAGIKILHTRAEELRRNGDDEGSQIWSRVASEVERHQSRH